MRFKGMIFSPYRPILGRGHRISHQECAELNLHHYVQSQVN